MSFIREDDDPKLILGILWTLLIALVVFLVWF
jgi:hypothetical protein